MTTRALTVGVALLVSTVPAWRAAAGAAPKAPSKVEARGPATHTVTIDASSYQPATLTVRVGDSIVWVNKDLLVHTATTQPGGFDSQAIAPGKSWKYTAKTEGEIAYSCTFHPAMKGTIRVR